VKTSLEPAIAAVRPALESATTHTSPAAPSTTAAVPAVASPTTGVWTNPARAILRHWFTPHGVVVLAHDVMPGVHAIRAKAAAVPTLALSFGRPRPTRAAHAPFRAGGWLRSDASGVTVCIRALETFRHRTIRTTETCSVAHRNWRHVWLRSRTVAKGHRLTISVYELGVAPGDSFDVGGFRVAR
jgi:hypothetical protein